MRVHSKILIGLGAILLASGSAASSVRAGEIATNEEIAERIASNFDIFSTISG